MNKKYITLAIVVIFIILGISLYCISLANIFSEFSKALTCIYLGLFVLALVALTIVTIQRVKEIKKGEEDDISKY